MSAREVIDWFTSKGKHIPIFKGESKQDALNRTIAQQNEDKKQADIERNKKQADALNKKNVMKTISDSQQLDSILSDNEVQAKDLVDRVEYTKSSKFHKFKDEAQNGGQSLGTHFTGDMGDDEWDYMNEHSNFNSIIKEAEKNDESWAFESWTKGQFMEGQQYKGFSKMSEKDQQATRLLDKYLDKSTLDTGIVVNRRATSELLGFNGDITEASDLKDLKGSVVLSKGNMSTCAAKEGLLIGSMDYEKPIGYKIHIPAGAKGAGMWVGDERINPVWKSKQREFLMNRDAVFLVGDIEDDAKAYYDSRSGEKFYEPFVTVNLYYIGRTPHDYN